MDRRQQDTEEQQRWEEEEGSDRSIVNKTKDTKMSLMVSDTGGDFKQVPAGTFLARSYRIIDLGTQPGSYNGQDKASKKLMIGWEVFGTDEEDQPLVDEKGLPLTVAKRYTKSLGSKANLRKDLEGWRGRAFTKEELDGFDMANVMGQYCMLSIVHEDVGDKVYANVMSISRVPKEMRANLPKAANKDVIFSIADPDMEVFESFHEKLRATIAKSSEWQERLGKAKPAGVGSKAPAPEFADDDIPF